MTLVICQNRQKIIDVEGHALVMGGPGSGKTTIAVAKAKKRIENGLSLGQSVLFLSFSRSAVARVIEASKQQIPREFQSQIQFQTFHSFFWEILRAYGYLLGTPRILQLLLPQDESSLRDGVDDENEEWAAERERLFVEKGQVVFDLFAPKAHLLLSRSHRLRDLFSLKHPLIIVDEAQDTAEDQWQIVKLLGEHSQLICLADLEQQIYDFRPGVSSERVTHIMDALKPIRVDLESQNHRSPDSEIVTFGNDILLNTPRGAPYKGVSRRSFRPNREFRDIAIRQSIGMANEAVHRLTGEKAENIAVLATWGRGVAVITKALTGDRPEELIPHRVSIDEAPVLLSGRVIAFLMEPRRPGVLELKDLADGLDLVANVYRAKGGVSGRDQARRLLMQVDKSQQGTPPRGNEVGNRFLEVLRKLDQHKFSGDPKRDWLVARRHLEESNSGPLKEVASFAEQHAAFQKGYRIANGLTELWQTQQNYSGARRVLETALSEEQLFGGERDLRGIHVMTLHKSKGKEFDAVLILDDSHNSPLIFCKEPHPFNRSRKLLRVGITRAKHYVLMLTDMYDPSFLLNGHNL
jgi:DNA helicase II / ATP-dependent DNA helicase PcrA